MHEKLKILDYEDNYLKPRYYTNMIISHNGYFLWLLFNQSEISVDTVIHGSVLGACTPVRFFASLPRQQSNFLSSRRFLFLTSKFGFLVHFFRLDNLQLTVDLALSVLLERAKIFYVVYVLCYLS